jgi:hypothetical protein
MGRLAGQNFNSNATAPHWQAIVGEFLIAFRLEAVDVYLAAALRHLCGVPNRAS